MCLTCDLEIFKSRSCNVDPMAEVWLHHVGWRHRDGQPFPAQSHRVIRKTRIRMKPPQLLKAVCENSTTNIIPNGESLETFLLTLVTR